MHFKENDGVTIGADRDPCEIAETFRDHNDFRRNPRGSDLGADSRPQALNRNCGTAPWPAFFEPNRQSPLGEHPRNRNVYLGVRGPHRFPLET
jgi:hypothetical protein